MKVRYFSLDTVDCTADPHVVDYDSFKEIKDDVIRVVESDLVYAVEEVTLCVDGKGKYGSDVLTVAPSVGKKQLKPTRFTRKNKVDGLYLYCDYEGPPGTHLPLGVEGVKTSLEKAWDLFENENSNIMIVVGVVWSFAMDSSCADKITIGLGEMSVDYSNQDWWITKDGYKDHIDKLAELLGRDIDYHEDSLLGGGRRRG